VTDRDFVRGGKRDDPTQSSGVQHSVVAIIQARMASTRLPGKALLELAGKPVLTHVIERVREANVGRIIVATTNSSQDDPISDLVRELGVSCYRGATHDVLGRFYIAHGLFAPDADIIARITADCPFLDPKLLRCVTQKIAGGYDYVGVRGAPDGYHQEAFTARSLAIAHRLAVTPYDREHVVPFMLARPAMFRVGWVEAEITGDPVTLDTADDLERLRRIAA
jgi:spore coat polysaccharide biosynthesis protein SpsF